MKTKKPYRLQMWVQVVGSLGEVAIFFMGFLAAKGSWNGMVAMLLARVVIKMITSQLMFHRQRANLAEFTRGDK